MNELSVLIYLSQVIPAFGVLCTIVGVIISVIFLLRFIFLEKIEELKKALYGVLLIAAFVILPQQHTMYMIAASEAGEFVLNLPETKEIYEDLRMVIQSYAKP